MKVHRESSAFTNPSLHLRMFSIRNPYVQWAIARGAYQDTTPRQPTLRDVGDADSLAVAKRMHIRIDYAPSHFYQEM